MTIHDSITQIESAAQEQHRLAVRLKQLYTECDYLSLVRRAEGLMRSASYLYLTLRGLLISLYELSPDLFPEDVDAVACESLGISVKMLSGFDYPVYQLSMPFLLPNKRKRNTDYSNAVTKTVSAAVRRFRNENDITPFAHATVIFVSSYKGEEYGIDNDNKESSVILNGLNGVLIVDDRPSTCDTIYCSDQHAQSARTEVYVVDSEHDIEVYTMIKNMSHAE